MHSILGRIVFRVHAYPHGPFLDPAKPIPRAHIMEAGDRAGIPAEQIHDTVASLSDHMGWDITKGSAV